MALRLKERILIELYLLKIKLKLQYPRKAKKLELKEYREIIYNVIEESGIELNKISDLYDEFATPDQYAQDLMDSIEKSDKVCWQNEQKVKSRIIFFIISLLAILLTFIFTVHYINSKNAFYNETKVESTSSINEEVL